MSATQLDAENEQEELNGSTEQNTQQDDQITDQDDLEQEEDAPRKSPHEEMMEEMFKKRSNQYKALSGQEDSDDDDDDDDDDDADDDADDQLDKDSDDEMVTLKVYGKEVVKTKAEVDEVGGVVAMQKMLAGEERLKEAARKVSEQQKAEAQKIIDENNRLKEENERLANLSKQQQDATATQDNEAEDRAKAKELTKKMAYGDADEVEDVMLTVVKATKQPPAAPAPAPVDPQVIARQVEADLEFKRDMKEAVDLFEKDNSDLNTKRLRGVVNDITKEVAKEHEDWSPVEIMAESIKIARADLNIPKPAAETPKDKLEGKKQRKKKVADVIPQANQRRDAPKSGTKVKTKQEIFEEISSRRSHR